MNVYTYLVRLYVIDSTLSDQPYQSILYVEIFARTLIFTQRIISFYSTMFYTNKFLSIYPYIQADTKVFKVKFLQVLDMT